MDYDHLKNYNLAYKNHKDIIDRLNKLLDEFEVERKDFEKLIDYYYSDEFRKDFDDSNNYKIDKDIDQTILTEDAIYDLMGDDYNLSLRLLDLANKMIQNK